MTFRQRWTLVATVIGSGAVFLDGTIVNVALPRIGRDPIPTDSPMPPDRPTLGVWDARSATLRGGLGTAPRDRG